jgi:HAD superfamily hydrolase (TIGR01509 family)
MSTRVKAVFFDLGETLVDENRAWLLEAERAGISPFLFFTTIGALIERGADHRKVWELLGLEREPFPVRFEPGDLYPDALPCLGALRSAGFRVGLAGNDPGGAADELVEAGLPVELVGSAGEWGVEKPSPAFFERLAAEAGLPPAEIAYVGDRVDNDVVPAKAAGMFSIFARRGPWGLLQASGRGAGRADATVDSLLEIPPLLGTAR